MVVFYYLCQNWSYNNTKPLYNSYCKCIADSLPKINHLRNDDLTKARFGSPQCGVKHSQLLADSRPVTEMPWWSPAPSNCRNHYLIVNSTQRNTFKCISKKCLFISVCLCYSDSTWGINYSLVSGNAPCLMHCLWRHCVWAILLPIKLAYGKNSFTVREILRSGTWSVYMTLHYHPQHSVACSCHYIYDLSLDVL